MVQPVPSTTSSISRCVEPWEFKALLHSLWPRRVNMNSSVLLLVLSFPEIEDNQCFPSKQLNLIITGGGRKIFSASQQCSPACCHVYNEPQTKTAEWFWGMHLPIAHEQLYIRTIPCTRGLLTKAPFPCEQQWKCSIMLPWEARENSNHNEAG